MMRTTLEKKVAFVKENLPKVAPDRALGEKLGQMFENCWMDTIEKTMNPMEDGTTYAITGDIPAMWLRDSAAQIKPYLPLAREDAEMADLIVGLIQRQFRYINLDPYANAFNQEANGACWEKDETEQNDWIWERKYEIDSLCYPVWLSYLFWKNTDITRQFDESFLGGVKNILRVFSTEQNHEENSPYHFVRRNCTFTDTLSRDGRGALVKSGIGLTWSGFRPSDDACVYGYLIPSNMFAVVILGYLSEILKTVYPATEETEALAGEAKRLQEEIRDGIEKHAVTAKAGYGDIYAYEVDGFGQYNLMDDANVPSLLSMKYLGYEPKDPQVAANTRNFILSEGNPYYYRGQAASGIGSAHTLPGYIWHISLSMQGLTTDDSKEKWEILKTLSSTEAGCMMMHEGFLADNPGEYTRPWFSWANSLFCELVLNVLEQ